MTELTRALSDKIDLHCGPSSSCCLRLRTKWFWTSAGLWIMKSIDPWILGFLRLYYEEGCPSKQKNLYMKNCVIILTCLDFSHLQSTLHLIQYTYQDIFPLLKTVFELINYDVF